MSANVNAAIDVIATRATTAGASLSPAVTDVARGDPIPGPGESVRVWYAGEADPPKFPGGATVNSDLRGERAVVTCYFPVPTSDQAVAQARDRRIFSLKDALVSGLLAGSTLGGNVTDIEVQPSAVGFHELNGTPYRVLEVTVLMSFTEYSTAA